ncbi:hypothetical protein TRICI_005872 [Trichomonascus ciferrii]|uniref:Eisosome protein 1 n=1 Tax=Trichomonascus ciferrii TaxID=44093 RepID=A0A642UQM5_9ASCO|nr:hypothetical protein TRICI_005872 [Trichomonascus ciferrii]
MDTIAPKVAAAASTSATTKPAEENRSSMMHDKSTSTVNEQASTPRSAHRSVSSVNKGLSPAAAAANYAKQVKYGVYEKPGAPIVGVPTRSSDTAATLAAKSDLSLKLWHHDSTSAAAGTAAVLAKDNTSAPELWKPNSSSQAASAALLAKDKNDVNTEVRNRQSMVAVNAPKNASKAALSAHRTPGQEMAAQALPDAYSWREREDSKAHVTRSASSKVYRQNSTASSHYSNDGRKRSSSVTSASTYGIDPNSLHNISGLESKARQNVEQRLSKLYLSSSSGHQLKISNAGSEAAAHALATTKEENDARYLKERDAFLQDEVKKHVAIMEHARERAAGSLAKIDQSVTERNPLHNSAHLNQEAVDIAERNLRSRLEHHGKIDIGGGKFMTQTEIEDIAHKNVKPVLEEISERADEQRAADEERRQHEEEERIRVAEEKRIDKERKAEDKRLKKEEQAKQKAIHDREKAENKKIKDEQKAEDKKRKNEQKALVKERRHRIRQERRELVEQKIREKIHSKKLWSDAKHASDSAKAEAAKTAAYKEAKEAQLEKAKLVAENAEGEAAVEAQKDVELKEAELADAEKAHQEAQANVEEKLKATHEAESTHIAQEREEQEARDAAAVESESESEDESSREEEEEETTKKHIPEKESGLDSDVALPVIATDRTVMDADHDKQSIEQGGLDSTVALPVISTDNTVIHKDDDTADKPTVSAKEKGKQKVESLEQHPKEYPAAEEQEDTTTTAAAATETSPKEEPVAPVSSYERLPSSPKKKLTGWMGSWKTRLRSSSTGSKEEPTPSAPAPAPAPAVAPTTSNHKEKKGHVPGKISSSLNKIGKHPPAQPQQQRQKQPLETASDANTSGLAATAAVAATSSSKQPNGTVKERATYPEQELPEIEVERTFSGFSDQDPTIEDHEPSSKKEGMFQEQIN